MNESVETLGIFGLENCILMSGKCEGTSATVRGIGELT